MRFIEIKEHSAVLMTSKISFMQVMDGSDSVVGVELNIITDGHRVTFRQLPRSRAEDIIHEWMALKADDL